ncbi:phage major capsid protein [Clavibacter michiganensis]|uniref:Phage capsid family protein n=1 Tax=Clavibacter michiganensis TaxID=28447 RepID=A0A251YMX4_9MICO|nr:phage major capsid protein [Clavibacter michiganensis]OUE25513.1 Phage capsid family protein [Clavibacter michiganensis]
MTIFTNTDDVSGLLPAEYGDLIIRPVEAASVALSVSSSVVIDAHDWHVPILTDDAGAAWVDEGDDLTNTEPKFAELVVTPSKVGAVIAISRELADDSSPEAAAAVADSIGRAIAAQVDRAYFGNLATPAPKGLDSLTGTTAPAVLSAGASWANTDPFAAAIASAQLEGATIDNFVANPVDYLQLMQLKRQVDSNEPLLGLDATSATRRLLLGVPLLASKHVEPGTIWGIPKQKAIVVIRKNVTVTTSDEVYFTTDRVAVKSTMRVGFAFPQPKALVKIELGV